MGILTKLADCTINPMDSYEKILRQLIHNENWSR